MKPSSNLRATVICRFEDQVLLVRKPASRWMLPGGRVEDDESPTAAALRELNEETGLSVDNTHFSFEYSGKKRTHYVYTHVANSLLNAQAQNEIEECRWFPVGEIANLRIGEAMRNILSIADRTLGPPCRNAWQGTA